MALMPGLDGSPGGSGAFAGAARTAAGAGRRNGAIHRVAAQQRKVTRRLLDLATKPWRPERRRPSAPSGGRW
ncbi:hypothetical protein JYK14_08985 [Siccirubricoccus sp. KC 17139]|uniref:Uncharacterized protein n=1 Tax=Siccirubricoccus soli TaxID=2899147 RepID=A0ABT1D305_9PROT|nr:hypothetical protein [Siccirubricoccus soli]MCO6416300.1 hypothetical protein [Siccirubricoccus soli]MCP2682434.1 hypothetical protein [Siccirubricoccus soli]